MLRLLAENETAHPAEREPAAGGGDPAAAVGMLDRMVDLAEVLSGAPARPSQPPAAARPAPAAPPAEPAPFDTRPVSRETARVAASLEAIAAAWPELVAEVRGRSRFLGEALGHATRLRWTCPGSRWRSRNPTHCSPNSFSEARLVEDVLSTATGRRSGSA